MILALDPSRVLGWCRGEPGGELAFGHIPLARKGSESGEIGAALADFLAEAIESVNPDLIVYEQPFLFSSPQRHTAEVLFGMAFYIDTVAYQSGIEYKSVMAIEATKALTGRAKFPGVDYASRRKAKKLATIEACKARGWDATEDEADAIAVFLLAEAKRFPEAAMSRPMVLKAPSGPLFAEATCRG